nr:thiamine pyrophosphate-dependent enzyme [Marinicella sp. W31]MDC2878600.1 thiamine pyrophosphate-dependent enzyme [Marinicella sp. W31]
MPEENRPYAIRTYAPEVLKEALRKMYLIRKFEEGAEQSYMRGLIHGTMHLSIGQEASAVGSCISLSDNDKITSTHRGHGHCVAKGADLGRMFAEFLARKRAIVVAAAARCTLPMLIKAIWVPMALSAVVCQLRWARLYRPNGLAPVPLPFVFWRWSKQ